MVLIANLLNGIAYLLDSLIWLVEIIVIVRVVMSFIPLIMGAHPDPRNPFVRFVIDSTDPLLRPIQRFLPVIKPGIDLSPLLLMLLLHVARLVVVDSLVMYARQLL